MKPVRLILKAANPAALPVPLADVVALVRESTGEWTPMLLSTYVKTDYVPQEWITRVCALIDANPSLIRVEKPDFLAAVRVARPDLYAHLTTTAGDAWLERCMLELGKTLFVTPFLRLLTGG